MLAPLRMLEVPHRFGNGIIVLFIPVEGVHWIISTSTNDVSNIGCLWMLEPHRLLRLFHAVARCHGVVPVGVYRTIRGANDDVNSPVR